MLAHLGEEPDSVSFVARGATSEVWRLTSGSRSYALRLFLDEGRIPVGRIDAFIRRHPELIGTFEIPGIEHPLEISRDDAQAARRTSSGRRSRLMSGRGNREFLEAAGQVSGQAVLAGAAGRSQGIHDRPGG